PYRLQNIAAQQALACLGVIERFHSEMVACAKQKPAAAIPYQKGKVSNQMLQALLAPHLVSMQDQLGIRRLPDITASQRFQLVNQLRAGVHSCIGGDPHLAVQRAWLLSLRVAEADFTLCPY